MTPSGIEPATFQLVAQCLNPRAPNMYTLCDILQLNYLSNCLRDFGLPSTYLNYYYGGAVMNRDEGEGHKGNNPTIIASQIKSEC